MRRIAWIWPALVLVGCSEPQQEAATLADSATAAAPAAISLADVAGMWNVRVMPEQGDTVVASYVMTATPDTAGWSLTFTGRTESIPIHVMAVAGDSVVTHMGPFESAVRPGVMVQTEAVVRLQNGMLMGRAVGHYTVSGPDSVASFRLEGTRAQ